MSNSLQLITFAMTFDDQPLSEIGDFPTDRDRLAEIWKRSRQEHFLDMDGSCRFILRE
jgi:hypothetical protein